MKTNRARNMMALALATMLWFTLIAPGQYALDWHAVAGGGGISAGGAYEVTGTMGQPGAGPAQRGREYALQGGFWALIGVMQTDGAPALSLVNHHNGTVTLSWMVEGAHGFRLQAASDLVAEDWADVPDEPTVVGDQYQVTVSLTATRRIYRLWKP